MVSLSESDEKPHCRRSQNFFFFPFFRQCFFVRWDEETAKPKNKQKMSRSLISAGSSKRSGKKVKSQKDAEDDALTVPMLQVGDEIPDFTCDSTTGLFNFHDIIDGSFSVSSFYF
jgi:hypothetical protein